MARPRKNAAAVTAPGNHDRSTAGANEPKPKRARKSKRPAQPQRSSAYRGVTRHRWTGRFEAHLWDKDTTTPRTRNHDPQPQAVAKKTKKKKGRQVYLGAYDDEEAAARAHDLAALKYWGPGTVLNFPLCSYEEELREMEAQSREEYVGSVRRKSSGFSRGVSKYRGVARHHHNGRWEARIGRVLGNKYLYLGTYATQEEAAVAYDIAAIEHRGINAVTNFDIGHYVNWHRRRRSLLGKEGLDATGMSPIPPLPADDDPRDTVAAAACVDDAPRPSALVLLLQASPKFTEIMEQAVSAAALTTTECNDNSSPSSPCSTSSSSTSVPSRPSPELQQPDERISGGASSSSSSARCGFPDDVQTYFECDEDDGISLFALAEVDTFLFGDLGSYAAPMFQCDDLDVFISP